MWKIKILTQVYLQDEMPIVRHLVCLCVSSKSWVLLSFSFEVVDVLMIKIEFSLTFIGSFLGSKLGKINSS